MNKENTITPENMAIINTLISNVPDARVSTAVESWLRSWVRAYPDFFKGLRTTKELEEATTIKVELTDNYYPVQCEGCGWIGSSSELEGGHAIADTGDHGDVYCPVCGYVDPKEGSEVLPITAYKDATVKMGALVKQWREAHEAQHWEHAGQLLQLEEAKGRGGTHRWEDVGVDEPEYNLNEPSPHFLPYKYYLIDGEMAYARFIVTDSWTYLVGWIGEKAFQYCGREWQKRDIKVMVEFDPGATKKDNVDGWIKCPACKGFGYGDEPPHFACNTCGGKMRIPSPTVADRIKEFEASIIPSNRDPNETTSNHGAEEILKRTIEEYNSSVPDFFKFALRENEVKMFVAMMEEYSKSQTAKLQNIIEQLQKHLTRRIGEVSDYKEILKAKNKTHE